MSVQPFFNHEFMPAEAGMDGPIEGCLLKWVWMVQLKDVC